MEEWSFEKRIQEKRRQQAICRRNRLILYGVSLFLAFFVGLLVGKGCGKSAQAAEDENEGKLSTQVPVTAADGSELQFPDWIDQQYIRVNPYSRPGEAVTEVNAIVVHYIGNPGTTAKQNRDYFDELADLGDVSMSSNFVVGLEGEVLACVPPGEVAYASNHRNHDTISIENCHPDESGVFTDTTYQSLVRLTAWLCDQYELDPLNGGVIRHYDVTGKICPKDFVENPEKWDQFLVDVAAAM